jgi:plastocyanin
MRTGSKLSFRVVGAAALFSLLLVSCGSGSDGKTDTAASPEDSTTTTSSKVVNQGIVIHASDFMFDPPTASITEGETVTWVNDSEVTKHAVEHLNNAAAGEPVLFDVTLLAPGEEFTAQPKAGTFDYHCQIHPDSMVGSIIVQPATD